MVANQYNNIKHYKTRSRLLLIAGIIVIVIGFLLYINVLKGIYITNDDFKRDYYAARHFLSGESIYQDTLHPNYHPPFIALLILPIAYLPYSISSYIWSIITISLYFFSMYLVLNELRIKLPIEWRMILIGFLICWYPFLENLILGQISIVISTCIIAAWVLLRRGRETYAGILIGFASLIKLFPIIFIAYFIFRKRWRSLLGMVIMLIAGFTITTIIIGPQSQIQYVTEIAPRDINNFAHYPINLSFGGIFRRLFTENDLSYPIINSPIVSTIGIWTCTFLIMVLAIYRAITSKNQYEDDISYALIILAMLLISPITWEHILPILILPFGLSLSILVKKYNPNISHLNLLIIILVSIPNYYLARFIYNSYLPDKMTWYAGLFLLFPSIGLLLSIPLLLYCAKIHKNIEYQ